MTELTELFKPASIGTLQLSNCVVMAPMFTQIADPDGSVSERICAYYDARARGSIGLIIVENTSVAPGGDSGPRELRIDDDRFIPGLKRLAETIHKHSVKAAIQLHHAGRQRASALGQPVAPSAIPCKFIKSIPRELTTAEADRLVEDFADAAQRAKTAGFDAVEFHGAHGYLICQFLSGYTNRRRDKYGGSFENRMCFALEIVKKTRERIGYEFPILFRISAKEFVETGLDLEETKIIARRLQEASVDCIDVSAGNYETGQWSCQPGWIPRGCLGSFAEEIKKDLTVPVIVAGRMPDPRLAERVLREGKADLIAFGRPFLADPDILVKAKRGQYDAIRMCMACCHCMDSLMRGQPLSCAVNPEVGREIDGPVAGTKTPRDVVVVGGGPGGLEAARVAALRGHRVSLFERQEDLGGQLILAAVPPGKSELLTTIQYFKTQMRTLGVHVETGRMISAGELIAMRPDAVIIATGSITELPAIPGASLGDVVLARDVISGAVQTGRKVIVVGGGLVGCEAAIMLSAQGKDVILVRISGKGRLGGSLGPSSRPSLLKKLTDSGVRVMADAPIESINQQGAVVRTKDGSIQIDADTIVVSPHSVPDTALLEGLRGNIGHIEIIGDCGEAGSLMRSTKAMPQPAGLIESAVFDPSHCVCRSAGDTGFSRSPSASRRFYGP